tara:strand:- start:185 stop:1051 length:867 start_codon:yes stop_codon:yes gene_type:complete
MLPNNLIGQTSDEKLNEIYNYLKIQFKDKGNILEFGTFLGKVTYSLSLIQKEKLIKNKIFTFDMFIWNELHQKKFPNLNIKIGSSFLEKTKSIVSNKNINYVEGNIENFNYEDSSIVEVLILDAPKEFEEIKSIFQKLNNKFLPNVTKVIFMDFFLPTKYDSIVFLYLLKTFGTITFSKHENVFFELNKEIDLTQLNIKKIYKEDYSSIKKFVLSVENEKSRLKLNLPMILLKYNLCGFFSTISKILYTNELLRNKKYVLTRSFFKRYYIIYPFILLKMIYEYFKKKN